MELARDKSPNEQAEQYLRAQRWSGVEPLNLAPAQVAALASAIPAAASGSVETLYGSTSKMLSCPCSSAVAA